MYEDEEDDSIREKYDMFAVMLTAGLQDLNIELENSNSITNAITYLEKFNEFLDQQLDTSIVDIIYDEFLQEYSILKKGKQYSSQNNIVMNSTNNKVEAAASFFEEEEEEEEDANTSAGDELLDLFSSCKI
jgi:hypothetical protein